MHPEARPGGGTHPRHRPPRPHSFPARRSASDHQQRDVAPHPGGPFRGQQVAGGRLEELPHRGVLPRRRVRHVHDASQAAMQRLTEANKQLQVKETASGSKEADSAPTQHNRKASGDVSDAK
jgi:multidrug resistance efflux pump